MAGPEPPNRRALGKDKDYTDTRFWVFLANRGSIPSTRSTPLLLVSILWLFPSSAFLTDPDADFTSPFSKPSCSQLHTAVTQFQR